MNPTRFNKSMIAYVVLGCSLLLNIVLLINRSSTPAAKEVAKAPAVKPAVAKAAAAAPNAAKGEAVDSEWKETFSDLKSSPSRTFQEALNDKLDGDQLAQTYARLFVFDVNLRSELSPGDKLSVSWRRLSDDELEIRAARLVATKKNKTYNAYLFQAPGDKFASYWNEQGIESTLQLKNGPLKEYQQITSLIKDRPTHKGMDFKTPVGTEVRSPLAGEVLRTNWNWTGNGNCVEIQYGDGTLAKFLHLSENKVKPGDKVVAGQVVALSGNTGHSTGPHLHYQLNQGEKVVDPIDYHGTQRRQLDEAAMLLFRPAMAALESKIAERTAGL